MSKKEKGYFFAKGKVYSRQGVHASWENNFNTGRSKLLPKPYGLVDGKRARDFAEKLLDMYNLNQVVWMVKSEAKKKYPQLF